jgi:3-deoxy-D-manno-octulosonic-acid transferase
VERTRRVVKEGGGGAFLVYDSLLYLVAFFLLPWAGWRCLRHRDFREVFPGRLGWAPGTPAGAPSPLLLHGVSVGEVKALRPLVRLLQQRHPGLPLAVSAATPGGLAIARATYPGIPVHVYPVDLPGATRRFLDRVRPRAVVLAELEIWPNFLHGCHARGIPVAIVNGRITESSVRGYRRVQRWLPRFDRVAVYCVQNEQYAQGFYALGVPPERVVMTGNMKYDNLPTEQEDRAYQAAPWRRWRGTNEWVVWASTHAPEEEDLAQHWARSPASATTVIAVVPRHPRRADAIQVQLERWLPGRVLRRSALAPEAQVPPGSVLLVDTFGELEQVLRTASAAFVGGSLIEHGGQNVLEAAALGLPVVVGPHTQNFAPECELLERAGGLRRASDAAAVIECLTGWLADPASARAAGSAGAGVLASRRGAAESTLSALTEAGLLPSVPVPVPGNVSAPSA